jgi:aryl-alcohol dehydrogenase-like predicted oxidoreductase
MNYRELADTGVFVSELCLGTMTFGGRGQIWEVIGGIDQPSVDALVSRALDAGINFVDTANVYAAGESETMLGKALGSRRHEVVLATKVRGRTGPGPNQVGLSRLHILQSVEASLKRLDTDYIDLYQIHRFDLLTNIEDTLRALDDLVHSGKVRYIGCSNLAAWQADEGAGRIARTGTGTLQVHAVVLLAGRPRSGARDDPAAEGPGTGVAGVESAGRRLPVGKVHARQRRRAARRAKFDFPPVNKEKGFDILDVAKEIADRHGVSVAQIAMAWILANSAVTSVIIGARKPAQLEDNLKAIDVRLSAEDMKALDEVSKLTTEYPAWMDNLGTDRRPGERQVLTSRP